MWGSGNVRQPNHFFFRDLRINGWVQWVSWFHATTAFFFLHKIFGLCDPTDVTVTFYTSPRRDAFQCVCGGLSRFPVSVWTCRSRLSATRCKVWAVGSGRPNPLPERDSRGLGERWHEGLRLRSPPSEPATRQYTLSLLKSRKNNTRI